MTTQSEFLDSIKKGFKGYPIKPDDLLPVRVTLMGYADLACVQSVDFYFTKDSEIDLSHYYPNLNLTLKLCENVTAGAPAESSESQNASEATESPVAE